MKPVLAPSGLPTDETDCGWWPTPRAADGLAHRLREPQQILAAQARRGRRTDSRLEHTLAIRNMQGGGYANPQFIEWLMGYPPEWTAASEPSETPSCRKSQN